MNIQKTGYKTLQKQLLRVSSSPSTKQQQQKSPIPRGTWWGQGGYGLFRVSRKIFFVIPRNVKCYSIAVLNSGELRDSSICGAGTFWFV